MMRKPDPHSKEARLLREKLDEDVLAAIRSGERKLASVMAAVNVPDALLGTGRRRDATERIVDRALQRLRKAGRIRYQGGWKTVP